MVNKLPLINNNFSQPTAAAALTIVPKFPGSLILSQIIVKGMASSAGSLAATSGISKIPVAKNINNYKQISTFIDCANCQSLSLIFKIYKIKILPIIPGEVVRLDHN